MASYLVTGGAGVVGSHIVETPLQKGEDVRVVDRFSTGNSGNLEPFNHKFELIEADIKDAASVKTAVSDIDYVIHVAAQGRLGK